MYSQNVEGVVRAHVHDTSLIRTFKTPEGIADVVRAVDVGVCRIVPLTDHAVRILDTAWNIELGVELTDHGVHVAARLSS